jgi:hypothetical protein
VHFSGACGGRIQQAKRGQTISLSLSQKQKIVLYVLVGQIERRDERERMKGVSAIRRIQDIQRERQTREVFLWALAVTH